MKQYHPRSWLQSIPPSAPCDHMSASPSGAYVEAQEANEEIARLTDERDEALKKLEAWAEAWKEYRSAVLVFVEGHTLGDATQVNASHQKLCRLWEESKG